MAQNYAATARAGRAPLAPMRRRGAWKLAYADFLTALCAFFMIMWLVHGVSSDEKADLAAQFSNDTDVLTVAGSVAPQQTQLDEVMDSLLASDLLSLYPAIVRPAADRKSIRIELVDLDRSPLFDKGSPTLNPNGKAVISLTAKAISTLGFDISIEGHTDSDPVMRDGYSNWELSTERANAARRALLTNGLEPSRLRTVAGLADTRPLDAGLANLPQNRRLSIVLHLD